MRRTESVLVRGGAGAVAILAATFLTVPTPAQADDPRPTIVVTAADLNTPGTRVGGGDSRPLRAEIRNEGDAPATGLTYTISLTDGTRLSGPAEGCTYTDYWPDDEGDPWAYGPSEATCTVDSLAPGESLPLAFTVSFGRNMWGPDQFYGYISVPLDDDYLSADFSWWSKRNTHDVAVTVPTVRGSVGQTADLTFTVVNYGPSDGGGPDVLVTAPRGTALLPTEWCWTEGTPHEQRPESRQVRCNFESFFPTVHSGYGRVSHTIPLKIKARPGQNGRVYAEGDIVDGTESRPANNTARIIVRP
jgi:hypothetical protein